MFASDSRPAPHQLLPLIHARAALRFDSTPVFSMASALFSAMAPSHLPYFQCLAHSFPSHGRGGPPKAKVRRSVESHLVQVLDSGGVAQTPAAAEAIPERPAAKVPLLQTLFGYLARTEAHSDEVNYVDSHS